MAERERWRMVYREAPDVFAAFAEAEARDGRIAAALQTLPLLHDAVVLEIGTGTGRLAASLGAVARAVVAVEPELAMLALASGVVEACAAGPVDLGHDRGEQPADGVVGAFGDGNVGRGRVRDEQPADGGAHVARARASCPRRPVLVRARGEALPVSSESIDVVLGAWVLAHLSAAARRAALAEAHRVLRPGGAVVALESAASSEFQDLRRLAGADPERELARLAQHGFERIAIVEGAIEFAGTDDAELVLGGLCGAAVAAELRARPRHRIGHAVELLVWRP